MVCTEVGNVRHVAKEGHAIRLAPHRRDYSLYSPLVPRINARDQASTKTSVDIRTTGLHPYQRRLTVGGSGPGFQRISRKLFCCARFSGTLCCYERCVRDRERKGNGMKKLMLLAAMLAMVVMLVVAAPAIAQDAKAAKAQAKADNKKA